jgi:hypothetical protein
MKKKITLTRSQSHFRKIQHLASLLLTFCPVESLFVIYLIWLPFETLKSLTGSCRMVWAAWRSYYSSRFTRIFDTLYVVISQVLLALYLLWFDSCWFVGFHVLCGLATLCPLA